MNEDPLAGLTNLFEGIGGLEQTAKVRRGLVLHQSLPRPPVGQTPHQVIHRQDKLAVRYYPASGEDRVDVPVVVLPSLINKAWICDLEPDRSLVGALSRAGHPVYLVDWGVPGPEDAHEDVGYVLLELLDRALFRIRHHARASAVHLLGYCQGGTVATMYTALRGEHVLSLACLATPVKFADAGRFGDFARAGDLDAILGPDGLVDLDVMKTAFKLLDPMGNWHKYIALEAASHDPRRLARTLARERWLEENVPLAGAFAKEFIQKAYREDALLEGSWEVREEPIDLGQITCPLAVLPCARDFIAPAQCCEPLATATNSRHVELEVLEAGHIGCVVGGFGPKVFYPWLDRWFRRAVDL